MDIPRNQIVVGIAKSKSLDGNQRDNERQSKLIHLMLCAHQRFDEMSKWKAYSFWLRELTDFWRTWCDASQGITDIANISISSQGKLIIEKLAMKATLNQRKKRFH